MFKLLQSQSQGIIEQTDELKLAMPPSALGDLNNVNSYGLSAAKLLKDAFPKIELVTVPEYDTASGRLVQMWAPRIDGQETATCGFTESCAPMRSSGTARTSARRKAPGRGVQ